MSCRDCHKNSSVYLYSSQCAMSPMMTSNMTMLIIASLRLFQCHKEPQKQWLTYLG